MKQPSFRISPAVDALWERPDEADALAPATLVVLTPPLTPDGEAAQLVQNIVKACKLPEADTRILSFEGGSWPAWYQLQKELAPKLVLSMGIIPEQLAIQARFHSLQPVDFGGVVWVLAPDPDELATNRELRERLWRECLKPFFGGGGA
jgi:hypothetical protein